MYSELHICKILKIKPRKLILNTICGISCIRLSLCKLKDHRCMLIIVNRSKIHTIIFYLTSVTRCVISLILYPVTESVRVIYSTYLALHVKTKRCHLNWRKCYYVKCFILKTIIALMFCSMRFTQLHLGLVSISSVICTAYVKPMFKIFKFCLAFIFCVFPSKLLAFNKVNVCMNQI